MVSPTGSFRDITLLMPEIMESIFTSSTASLFIMTFPIPSEAALSISDALAFRTSALRLSKADAIDSNAASFLSVGTAASLLASDLATLMSDTMSVISFTSILSRDIRVDTTDYTPLKYLSDIK